MTYTFAFGNVGAGVANIERSSLTIHEIRRMNEQQQGTSDGPAPHKRRITMEDGRYMIFYTFDGEQGRETGDASEPQRPAQREEERDV